MRYRVTCLEFVSSSVWRVAVRESLLERLGVWVPGSTTFHLSFGSAVGLWSVVAARMGLSHLCARLGLLGAYW